MLIIAAVAKIAKQTAVVIIFGNRYYIDFLFSIYQIGKENSEQIIYV